MQKEINLKVLFGVIKKRFLLLFIITAITTAASGYYSMTLEAPPPVYQSTASVFLNMEENNASNTLEVILRDPTVLSKVIEELGLNTSLDNLDKQITFVNEGGSKIVKITVSDTNPELAANIANSTAGIFTKQVGSILGIYETRMISEAQINKAPILVESESTSTLKYLVIGFGIGLVLSVGIVLFLDSLDETVHSEREIEQLVDLPTIGSIVKMNRKNMKSKNRKRTG
ncbi:YveK family protein [Peribacillus loiseleuriae]|uniref:Polysaccharide chain length determinant N-terminal domain-containing protein n=1 Tax=Peribacillus loiseleuriae TaxID=1679170 RepID=A0A0K9GZ70_9BACI|nr:Wzz/FepE/Etk N-terminal domain-containing protein [Peribacillus loiseleuriae]KMY51900.1 hypothetical protein AC625_22175 [Peribacillus loiseleuriae]